MASENDIAINVKIKAAESANTVKDLKKSLKDLKDELNNVESGSDSFKKLSKSINDTEGKIGDLNDSFNTLTGSGVERLGSSFNLLKDGFANFDLEKIKIGFKGLGAAMSAVPIFLLAEGIKYLVENFDVVIKAVEDFIGVSRDNEIQAKRVTEALEAQTQAYEDLTQISDRYTKQAILSAKARGAAEEEVNKIIEHGLQRNIKYAKEALEETVKNYNSLLRNEDATVEQIEKAGKILEESRKNLKKAEVEFENFKLQVKVDAFDNNKKLEDKAYQERKIGYDKELAEQKAREKELDDYRRLIEKEWRAEQLRNIEAFKNSKFDEGQSTKMFEDDTYQNTLKLIGERDKKNEESAKKEKELKQATTSDYLSQTQKALDGGKILTDLYFQHQLKGAKGNAEKEREIKKKAFQTEKAFRVVGIVLNTISSITQALGSYPPPASWIFAGINSALGTAATIAALSQKFDDGGSATVPPSLTANASNATPVVPTPNNTVTKIADDGTVNNTPQGPQKVYVLTSDINDSNKRLASVENSSKL